MLIPGLVSVTFRKLEPEQIIELARWARLRSIEWGGDVHVPHGNTARADAVGARTREAGLEVCCYGSYYAAGEPENTEVGFEGVLETALALGAPLIRVWAGRQGSGEAGDGYRQRVIEDSHRIAGMASEYNVGVAFEYHGNTLTDTATSTESLLQSLARPEVSTCWQPPVGASRDECLDRLRRVLPRLANIHCFHWSITGKERYPLVEGSVAWMEYLRLAGSTGRDHHVLLEFVRDDEAARLIRDAVTLREWLREMQGEG